MLDVDVQPVRIFPAIISWQDSVDEQRCGEKNVEGGRSVWSGVPQDALRKVRVRFKMSNQRQLDSRPT